MVQHGIQRGFVQVQQHIAQIIQAFRDLEAAVARDQRWWKLRLQGIKFRSILAANRQNIAESPRRNQSRARPFAFQDSIRSHGRAVRDARLGHCAQRLQPG